MARRSTRAKGKKRGQRSSTRRNASKRRRQQRRSRRWLAWLLLLLMAVGLAGLMYGWYLDHVVRVKFEGKRWAIPARVFARPLELYVGAPLTAAQFGEELKRLGYRRERHPDKPGGYSSYKGRFVLHTRPFRFWDGDAPSHYLEVRFDDTGLTLLRDARSGKELPVVRLEPPQIGSIYPAHHEDRILVPREDLPPMLVQTLLTVEDRAFYSHHGVDPKAILRALWSNLRAGSVVQGGSTLTQQLVKNFYLTDARTFTRKLNEAAMALLLEQHYGKDDILEAYANEIYLGQDGERAIHGFGLASLFYFSRPLNELDLPRIALLVGMIRGPSYYNPLRHPERARERRNLVLKLLAEQGVISPQEARRAMDRPLDVSTSRGRAASTHRAFLDVVRRQLHRDYEEEDLNSEGLRIFTTLDPWVQGQAEKVLAARLDALEKSRKLPSGKLQGAVVVASADGGELQAVVGGRHSRYAGFNRALDARRSVGSLIKPVVYLAALSRPSRYTLLTPVDDSPIEIRDRKGNVWSPENFDKTSHGPVPLHRALAHSYNQATVRLGMEVGLRSVIDTLRALGLKQDLKPYPSLLLGAVPLSPLNVAQLYQTLATGGFHAPLRAIREVTDAAGAPLSRYPIRVRQAADPAAVYLVDKVLQEVVRSGTGRGLSRWLAPEFTVAGKTGTTDDLRDSWFAGFTGDRVAVVWVGRDDNQPAGLTGGAGALQVWGDMMRRIGAAPLVLARPDTIEIVWIDPETGLRADDQCPGAVQFPFVRGSGPREESSCVQRSDGGFDFFRSLIE